MKKLLIFLLLLCASADAGTLAQLRTQFRQVTGERDSSVSLFSTADVNFFLNVGQNKVAKIGGYLDKMIDIIYSDDSLSFGLPATFKYVDPINGVVKRYGGSWIPAFENPGFKKDTNLIQYFIGRQDNNVARIYLRGGPMIAGDTIRVFFKAGPAAMSADNTECEVPDDLEWAVIDEAVALSERARRSFDVAQLLWQMAREDMGIEKQVRK